MARLVNVALFGDSTTTGQYDRGWPSLLQTALQGEKRSVVRVNSRGAPGASSNYLLAQAATVAALRDDIVLIASINDASAANQAPLGEALTPTIVAANYNSMIDQLRAQRPDMAIFLCALIRPSAAEEAAVVPMLPTYNALLQSVAQDRGVEFIDCYTAWGDPALHPEDYSEADGHPPISAYKRVCIPTISAAMRPLYD